MSKEVLNKKRLLGSALAGLVASSSLSVTASPGKFFQSVNLGLGYRLAQAEEKAPTQPVEVEAAKTDTKDSKAADTAIKVEGPKVGETKSTEDGKKDDKKAERKKGDGSCGAGACGRFFVTVSSKEAGSLTPGFFIGVMAFNLAQDNFQVGIGLRREHSTELCNQLPEIIDCLEIVPENYLETGGKLYREFRQLAEHYPIIFHGLSLSLASQEAFEWQRLKKFKNFLQKFKAHWFSDHLCYSSLLGKQIHQLLPLPWNHEAQKHIIARIRKVQDFFELPFAIENISYYALPGEIQMSEEEFISTILEQADCHLLLDVNNVYVNAINHGFDPYEYLNRLPLNRVLQVHVAGHREYHGFLLDHHGASIIDPVWNLLRYVLKKIPFAPIIIERDNNIPELQILLAEVQKAREIIGGLDVTRN